MNKKIVIGGVAVVGIGIGGYLLYKKYKEDHPETNATETEKEEDKEKEYPGVFSDGKVPAEALKYKVAVERTFEDVMDTKLPPDPQPAADPVDPEPEVTTPRKEPKEQETTSKEEVTLEKELAELEADPFYQAVNRLLETCYELYNVSNGMITYGSYTIMAEDLEVMSFCYNTGQLHTLDATARKVGNRLTKKWAKYVPQELWDKEVIPEWNEVMEGVNTLLLSSEESQEEDEGPEEE